MPAEILDGRVLSARIRQELKQQLDILKEKTGDVPSLVNFMVGDNDGSASYARAQEKAAAAIGIRCRLVSLPGDITQDDLIGQIKTANADAAITGIMIDKPFPKGLDDHAVVNAMNPAKDVEGLHVSHLGKIMTGRPGMIPCTAAAVMAHIREAGCDLYGKETVIVGASEIVGKPLALLLLKEMATVTVCHIGTAEAGRLEEHVARAEILIVAVGKPGIIPGAWVKPGACVIDVGINNLNGAVVGDVGFEDARTRAALITPVPGGVGPVTVMMLMKNALIAHREQKGIL